MTLTIKAPAIFQINTDNCGALPISPLIIKGHLGNDMPDLIRKNITQKCAHKKVLVVGYSRLKTEAIARAIIAANIVKISAIATYTLTNMVKFSEGRKFWLRTKKS